MTELAPIAGFGLLIVRPGMLVSSAYVFGGTFAPVHVRIGLSVLIAVTLMPFVPAASLATDAALPVVVLRETAIGLALGLSVRTLIAGAEMAGHLSGFQLGFAYASIVDPQGGVRNTTLAALYGNLAVLTFFGTNGHHALLRALADSYERLPIGPGGVDASLVTAVMGMLGTVFVLGVRLALPVITVLLVVEIAMGLIARIAPSLNPMVVGMPVRILVGLLALAAAVPLVPAVVARFSDTALGVAVQAALAFE